MMQSVVLFVWVINIALLILILSPQKGHALGTTGRSKERPSGVVCVVWSVMAVFQLCVGRHAGIQQQCLALRPLVLVQQFGKP